MLFLQILANKNELLTALNSTRTELIGVDKETRHTLLSTNLTLAAKVPFKFLLAFHYRLPKSAFNFVNATSNCAAIIGRYSENY